MKAGILTFFSANNYGAILQAFSLQKKVEEMYGSCECIDYKCPAIEAVHATRPLNPRFGLKKNVKNMARNLFYAPRVRCFASFRADVRHSKPYLPETIREANQDYDIFITGSDQVFNLKLTGEDETYFLNFAEDSKYKVAYAASMGPFLDEKKQTYQRLLSRFDLLSVREKSTAAELHEKLGIKCAVVPDPVFLHDAQEWKQLLQLGTDRGEDRYVLIYSLYESPELYRLANEYARKNACKVYAITKAPRPSGKADRYLRKTDPRAFVRLIMNADYIVTDSFHGTAFSLIFNKQLHVVLPPNAQNRIVDLFSELDISAEEGELDYERVNKQLALYRDRGVEFLKRIDARTIKELQN